MADSHRIEVYEDASGEFRWRKVALRGNLPDEIVAESGEGYKRASLAIDAAERENRGQTITLLNTAQEAEKPE